MAVRPLRLALIAALSWSTAAVVLAAPRRIVSLNVCADQILMAVADPGQVAALTPLSRDPTLSAYAVQARRWPVAPTAPEAVLALQPDLIVADPYRKPGLLTLMKGRRVDVLGLPPADSYAQIRSQILTLAAAVGHEDRGRAVVADMDRRLAALGETPRARGVAAYYQRRGYLTGAGTLVDEMMRRAGLENLATRLHRPALSRLSLEEIVAARPDYLILETGSDPKADLGGRLLLHPALLKAVPAARRLFIPQALTVCGGPFFPEAVARLKAQLDTRRR